MKNIKIILLLLVIAGVYSCETYKDPAIEYSPVYPLSGQWYIQVYDAVPDTLLSKSYFTMYSYNVSSDVVDSMWLFLDSVKVAPPCGKFRAKVACSVPNKSFSVTKSANNLYSNSFIGLTAGSVVLNGGKTFGGTVADVVSLVLTTDKKTGKTFKIKGVRVSGWPEDIPH